MEAQPVVAVLRGGLVREPGSMQGSHEEGGGGVAGEDTAGPVASVGRRREPDDAQARGRIAEAGHRQAPVVPRDESGPLLAGHAFPVLHLSGAPAALDDPIP